GVSNITNRQLQAASVGTKAEVKHVAGGRIRFEDPRATAGATATKHDRTTGILTFGTKGTVIQDEGSLDSTPRKGSGGRPVPKNINASHQRGIEHLLGPSVVRC